jgi:hypothetical protein
MIIPNEPKQKSELRFSTEEMENSRLRCGCEFNITSLFFGDMPNFPLRVLGYIRTNQGHQIRATWDQYGECTIEDQRIKSFDLIKRYEGDEVLLKIDDESLSFGLV